MSQAEVIRTEPYIKHYTDEEINKMCVRLSELLIEGKEDEAEILSNEIPLLPKTAEIWKKNYGVDDLIASGVNLYTVVKEYGEAWLER